MSAVEFEAWPKIARLNREIVVTEKIDGTNAAVLIKPIAEMDRIEIDDEPRRFFDSDAGNIVAIVGEHAVFAQSRSRFITPGADNYGFAGWVQRNAEGLVETLGEGRHFGEWWGAGIQRKYGFKNTDKFFSLFNTERYAGLETWGIHAVVPGLKIVPTLYRGLFHEDEISDCIRFLAEEGSAAAWDAGATEPQKAEGVVVYHTAARTAFKVTIEGDAAPKGPAAHAKDEER